MAVVVVVVTPVVVVAVASVVVVVAVAGVVAVPGLVVVTAVQTLLVHLSERQSKRVRHWAPFARRIALHVPSTQKPEVQEEPTLQPPPLGIEPTAGAHLVLPAQFVDRHWTFAMQLAPLGSFIRHRLPLLVDEQNWWARSQPFMDSGVGHSLARQRPKRQRSELH